MIDLTWQIVALVWMLTIQSFSALKNDVKEAYSKKNSYVSIKIEKKVGVAATEILLGDVATINTLDKEIKVKIAELKLLKFPKGSHSVDIPADYVKARIAEVDGNKLNISYDLPEKITFFQLERMVTISDVKEIILFEARLREKIPEKIIAKIVHIQIDKLPSIKPGQELSLSIKGRKSKWHGLMQFGLLVKQKRKTISRHWVRSRIKWLDKRWTTAREIGYHEKLSVEDFQIKLVEINPFMISTYKHFSPLELKNSLKNARAKRSIAVGSELNKNVIEKKPDILSGSDLKIVFKNDYGLAIESKGSVLENSSIGSIVKVRLKGTRKVVSGTLVDAKTIEVNL